MRYYLVLAVFIALVALLADGLTLDPHVVPSPLINKPAPHFELPQLRDANKIFSERDMVGKVWLLNVWASWCVSCREEHPVLLEFAKSNVVPVYGLDYKDTREDGVALLERFGDPYRISAFDSEGKVGIDYGVYGVPETYVIDKRGVIRYKQIGPITPDILKHKIIPLVTRLNNG
ncbi:MAG TPA: DsbE family thiol:disulfide interchange protein [Burkholderiales bacterium]|nr:DsbE family thiol:disulfide interchange protein [Burkholderiales bacterium]